MDANTKLFLATLLVFVDVVKDSIMVDDVVMPSNPPITLVKKEKLEETPFDVNVSQRSCEEKPSKKWCTLKLIVWHGIVNCPLTHMP